MALTKCRQCGCMAGALENLAAAVSAVSTDDAFPNTLAAWYDDMQPVRYSCLGCDYCFPAVAQNEFSAAFPAVEFTADLSCDFRVQEATWPPVVGEYFILDESAPVAVSTLAGVQLADELARRKPPGLAIVGKTETENIGIDKLIKNVISSSTLRYLILAGTESDGHLVGQTLLALAANGADEQGRVIGSNGKRPVLRNVSAPEIAAFRAQVQVIDMIGHEQPDQLAAAIAELAADVPHSCGCSACADPSPLNIAAVPTISAGEPTVAVTLDKAGYFVILPLVDKGLINVEHYAYDNRLLRVIEGPTAREIYLVIINNGWVTELTHAAYLGKELAKAELSLQQGITYAQDGA